MFPALVAAGYLLGKWVGPALGWVREPRYGGAALGAVGAFVQLFRWAAREDPPSDTRTRSRSGGSIGGQSSSQLFAPHRLRPFDWRAARVLDNGRGRGSFQPPGSREADRASRSPAGQSWDPHAGSLPAGDGASVRAARGGGFSVAGFQPPSAARSGSRWRSRRSSRKGSWGRESGRVGRTMEHHSIFYGPVNRCSLRCSAPAGDKVSPAWRGVLFPDGGNSLDARHGDHGASR